MILIADSSALIALSICDCLSLLDLLYNEVCVPEAVYREVTEVDKPQSVKLKDYLQNKIVQTDPQQNIFMPYPIDLGEQEAMILYKQLKGDVLLTDDLLARKVAQWNQIKVIGSLGVLLKSKQHHLIPLIKPLIEKTRSHGIYYSDQLIQIILESANETT